jgi:hypothetical protein
MDAPFNSFDFNRRGQLVPNREALWASEGYKRQIEALALLFDEDGRPRKKPSAGIDTVGG